MEAKLALLWTKEKRLIRDVLMAGGKSEPDRYGGNPAKHRGKRSETVRTGGGGENVLMFYEMRSGKRNCAAAQATVMNVIEKKKGYRGRPFWWEKRKKGRDHGTEEGGASCVEHFRLTPLLKRKRPTSKIDGEHQHVGN